jgi:hypothetical protein
VTRSRFLLVFALVLVLRIAVAAGFRGNFDTQSYLIAVQGVVSGQNVYALTERYNYSPLWSFVVAGVWLVASPNVGAFVLLVGLLLIAADAASTFLLIGIGRRRLGLDADEAQRRALLFFSNPVSVLISCAHGQFDGLSILFLLAALWLAVGPRSRASQAGVAGMLAMSLLVKHVTAFHPLLFSRRRQQEGLPDGLVLAPYLVFAASFLPYASAVEPILRHVFLYPARVSEASLQKPGGFQAFLSLAEPRPVVFSLLLLVAVACVLRATRRWELTRACLLLFLTLLCFSPSFAVQYLVWPIALGSLFPSAAYGLFTLAGSLYHSSAPESLAIPWPIRATSLGTWLAALLWFAAELLRARREQERWVAVPESAG